MDSDVQNGNDQAPNTGTKSLKEYLVPTKIKVIHDRSEDYVNLGKLGFATKDNVIEIPSDFKHEPLCKALIWYMKSVYCQELRVQTIAAKKIAVCSFFEFLENGSFNYSGKLEFSILKKFQQWCINTKFKNSKANYQTCHWRSVKKMLTVFGSERSQPNANIFPSLMNWHEDRLYVEEAGTSGRNIWADQEARSPISALFEDCPYTDSALILSLRQVCSHLLLAFDDARRALQNNERLKVSIHSLLQQYHLLEPPVALGYLYAKEGPRGDKKKFFQKTCEVYPDVINALLSLDDPFLWSWWATNFNTVRPTDKYPWDNPPSSEQIKKLSTALLRFPDGPDTPKLYFDVFDKTVVTRLTQIESLAISNILLPSKIEHLLMYWLLSADKHQDSGIKALTLDAIIFDDKQVTIITQKERRNLKNKGVLTRPHPAKSILYEAFQTYWNTVQQAQDKLPNNKKGLLFPLEVDFTLLSPVGISDNRTFRFLRYLTQPSSPLRQKLDNTLENGEPFYWLIEQLFAHNDVCRQQDSIHSATKRYNKKNPKKAKPLILPQSLKSLSNSFIRQSTIASEDTQTLQQISSIQETNLIAELSGHSPEVRDKVYTQRTRSKEVLTTLYNFEVKIAEMMEQEARAIKAKFNHMKDEVGFDVISKASVAKLCKHLRNKGLTDDMKSLYESYNAEMDEHGFAKANNRYLFLEHEESVALMLLHYHLNSQKLQNLISNSHGNRINPKTVPLLTVCVFIHHILKNRFEPDIVAKGKAIFTERFEDEFATLQELAL
ncbi:hypothetical protein ACVBIO_04680 [Shewanella sp. 0m-8]